MTVSTPQKDPAFDAQGSNNFFQGSGPLQTLLCVECRNGVNKKILSTIMRLTLTLSLLLGSFVRAVRDNDRSSSRRLDVGVFDIGNIRPEGIHILPEGVPETLGLGSEGTFALVSQMLYGGVIAVNVDTGETTSVVENLGFFERAAVGLWYANGYV
jgi:hypothetical protein